MTQTHMPSQTRQVLEFLIAQLTFYHSNSYKSTPSQICQVVFQVVAKSDIAISFGEIFAHIEISPFVLLILQNPSEAVKFPKVLEK